MRSAASHSARSFFSLRFVLMNVQHPIWEVLHQSTGSLHAAPIVSTLITLHANHTKLLKCSRTRLDTHQAARCETFRLPWLVISGKKKKNQVLFLAQIFALLIKSFRTVVTDKLLCYIFGFDFTGEQNPTFVIALIILMTSSFSFQA